MRLVAVAPNPSIDRFFGLERLASGTVNRPSVEVRVPGGKALNVARAAALLGADVSVVGILAGHAGGWVADALAEVAVRGTWTWVEGETRSCVAIHESWNGVLTELNEAGPDVLEADWARLHDAVAMELEAGDVGLLAVSGSLPPGAPADAIARLVELGRSNAVQTIVDGSGGPLALALAEHPWMVKVNLREAQEAARLLARAGPEPPAAAAGAAVLAQDLAAQTGGIVIVTLGPDGAVAASPESPTLRVTLPGFHGPYPVGSGDAFLAGLATSTLAGRPLADALRLASGAAAANSLVAGAGRLDPAEAFRLAASVMVEPLER